MGVTPSGWQGKEEQQPELRFTRPDQRDGGAAPVEQLLPDPIILIPAISPANPTTDVALIQRRTYAASVCSNPYAGTPVPTVVTLDVHLEDPKSTSPGTDPTILLVDDVSDNLRVLARLLQSHYRIRTSLSGAGALKVARSPRTRRDLNLAVHRDMYPDRTPPP
jgi:PleD family two-component response regulator